MSGVAARPIEPSGKTEFRFSVNNFDLIRLVAAAEVALRHTVVDLAPELFPYWLNVVFAFVPGVPIFFFLSGYLISRSWERSPSVREYARNRALRLFPALWCCVLFATAAIFLTGYMSTVAWQPIKLLAWMVGQGTIFQFWTPEFLRGFGIGAVNGSLWSISVEIQFYIATGVMYLSIRRLPSAWQTVIIGVLAALFSVFNGNRPAFEEMIASATGSQEVVKLFGVSFLPWYFIFLCGALAQRISGWIVPLCIEHATTIFAMYVAAIFLDFHFWGLPLGNQIPPYLVPLMGLGVLSAAYANPSLGHRLLGGRDFSYGLYIYHMPIANVLIQLGRTGSAAWIVVSLVLSSLCAWVSWTFVERPTLKRKKSAVRAIQA